MVMRLLLAIALAGGASRLAAQAPADSVRAVAGIVEFLNACRRDAGRLWGQSLCGPLIAVDGASGFAVATEEPPAGRFQRSGSVWIGRVPTGMSVANTATEWEGRVWSTVRLPMPTDPFDRLQLLAHEAFHRIQPGLGLSAVDALNPHLDERDGRYFLRLELRALAVAVRTQGPPSRRAALDGLLFRAARHRRYPGSDSFEALLERQEGLAQYTGARIGLTATNASPARVARSAADFEGRPSYVRALGYGTGPLLGLLLDRWAPGWRTGAGTEGQAARLARALSFTPPVELGAALGQRAARYGGAALALAEDERAAGRDRVVAGYRATLVDGPVIILAADGLMRSFDPNTLIPLGDVGTVYPTGSFEAAWGRLTVEHGGALVPLSNREVRVPAPADGDSVKSVVATPGYRLELAAGWRLRAGLRRGDWVVDRALP